MLRVVRGNPGHRPLPADVESDAAEVSLDPPEDLVLAAREEQTRHDEVVRELGPTHSGVRILQTTAREALKHWGRMAPIIAARGHLTEDFIAAFIAGCNDWGEYQYALRRVLLTGQVVQSPTGYPIQNPFVSIRNNALKRYRHFEDTFGFTPSARTRVGGRAASKPASKISRFMERRLKRSRR
jgi:P27 family predicted phage terminase small subunit